MPTITCPHCAQLVELIVQGGQPHSTQAATDPETIINGGYHPNPTKQYRTPEYLRRAGLAYYYENRERILLRAKDHRRRQKILLASGKP